MQISEEFLEDFRAFAILDYGAKLSQFHLLMTQHGGDGTHPDCVKAKAFLDRARRLRCEVDPDFAAQQLPQVSAA